jgi:capsular polysaccharide transport system permease protein
MGVILLMSLVFSQIARIPPLGTNFPLFYATGYMAFHFYLDISSTVSGAIQFNRPLLSFPRVTLIDTVIARFLLQFVTTCFVAAVLLGGFVIYAHDQVRIDPLPILLSVALAALLGLGVASVNCTLFIYSETWLRIFGIINRPTMLISGVFFLYEDLPKSAQAVLWWNPLVHLTALMREGFYPVYNPGFVSEAYVAFVSLVLLMLGVLLLRVLRADILER